MPVSPVFRRVNHLWGFMEDSPGDTPLSRQTAVLALCGRLSVRAESQGDSCMDWTTVCKENSVPLSTDPNAIWRAQAAQKLRRLNKE